MMEPAPTVRQYLSSAFFLMAAGWGGLVLLIFILQLPPLVWARWAFFALLFTALSGTALPVVYFLNLRFPSDPPTEPHSIVRQALWVGLYGCVVAWLLFGRVMTFWVWTGLAVGLIAVEYLIRMRERALWRPPEAAFGPSSGPHQDPASEDELLLEGDEPS